MPVEFLDVSPPLGETIAISAFDEILFDVKLDVEPWTDPKQVIVEVRDPSVKASVYVRLASA